MWWKISLVVLLLIAVFFVVGLYAGGAFFLHMTGGQASAMAWDTLYDARLLPLNDRRLLFLPWSWCVTAAITFLPAGLALLAMFVRLNPKTSLHGDARFANERELRQFDYVGEYKNTSKK